MTQGSELWLISPFPACTALSTSAPGPGPRSLPCPSLPSAGVPAPFPGALLPPSVGSCKSCYCGLCLQKAASASRMLVHSVCARLAGEHFPGNFLTCPWNHPEPATGLPIGTLCHAGLVMPQPLTQPRAPDTTVSGKPIVSSAPPSLELLSKGGRGVLSFYCLCSCFPPPNSLKTRRFRQDLGFLKGQPKGIGEQTTRVRGGEPGSKCSWGEASPLSSVRSLGPSPSGWRDGAA